MYFEKSIKLCFAMLKREKSAGSPRMVYSCAMHESTKTGINTKMIIQIKSYECIGLIFLQCVSRVYAQMHVKLQDPTFPPT